MRDRLQRLKVLHVIPSVASCRGGPSKAVIDMVSSLRKQEVDSEIATTNDNGRITLDISLNSLIVYQGVPVRFFERFSPPIRAVREFAYSVSFSNWLSKNIDNYDVLHIHAIFSYCSTYAMSLARKKRIPYVVRPIGQLQKWSLAQSQTRKKWYLKYIERSNIESASMVHYTDDSELIESSEVVHAKGQVIPLGITPPVETCLSEREAKKQWGVNSNDFIVLYLSRLHEKKGLELLMQALALIDEPSLKLLVAGDGEAVYKQHLDSLSKSLGLNERCSFLGHVEGETKAALLQHSELYALTSYSENFGISALEAMANGLAPLVCEGVALSNVIKKNQLGLVCETDIKQIETQLRFAVENQQQIKALGQQAKQYTGHYYSWTHIATQLKSLYQSII